MLALIAATSPACCRPRAGGAARSTLLRRRVEQAQVELVRTDTHDVDGRVADRGLLRQRKAAELQAWFEDPPGYVSGGRRRRRRRTRRDQGQDETKSEGCGTDTESHDWLPASEAGIRTPHMARPSRIPPQPRCRLPSLMTKRNGRGDRGHLMRAPWPSGRRRSARIAGNPPGPAIREDTPHGGRESSCLLP